MQSQPLSEIRRAEPAHACAQKSDQCSCAQQSAQCSHGRSVRSADWAARHDSARFELCVGERPVGQGRVSSVSKPRAPCRSARRPRQARRLPLAAPMLARVQENVGVSPLALVGCCGPFVEFGYPHPLRARSAPQLAPRHRDRPQHRTVKPRPPPPLHPPLHPTTTIM